MTWKEHHWYCLTKRLKIVFWKIGWLKMKILIGRRNEQWPQSEKLKT